VTPAVIAIVLAAAAMHAGWNALVKGAADRTVTLGLIATGHVIPAAFIVWLVPPPDPAAISYIVASTVIHWGYYVFLNLSYRWADLSFAYPVARGIAPVLIALGAVFAADEYLAPLAWAGIATVSAGILTLAAVRRAEPRGLAAALTTGLIIAAYSIADGLGIRVSGSPIGYVAWLFLAEVFVAVFVLATRRRRLAALPRRTIAIGLAGGMISALAYGLVLYAKTLAPLGIVSALRETSVIFAAMIGVLLMGEGPAGRRILAALIVAAGIMLLTIA
jgi:drug/metabolite transporter (DMT)-like permease